MHPQVAPVAIQQADLLVNNLRRMEMKAERDKYWNLSTMIKGYGYCRTEPCRGGCAKSLNCIFSGFFAWPQSGWGFI